ncbi:ABC transporter permease family protein [Anaerocellum danielii]|uniref:MacB-like periplasmic core domain-containing protein n=1 Tax=Anaerocellum danielii TaxID=1387557 RepID=A0ABZ0U2C7_9FIRM|nr:hypothetical protein [Caldicellulosiruptor danielii]WPX09451.1 hypothetical protein SOJ16_000660 [Caldicellulosiruptor danielii]
MTKEVYKLINRKTSLYLRISIVIFIFSIFLLVTIILEGTDQYFKFSGQFIENKNTHVIQVTLKKYGNKFRGLVLADEKEIKELLRNNLKNIKFDIIKHYQIPFGTVDETGYVYFINGLSGNGKVLLGIDDDFKKNGIGYTLHTSKEGIKTLNIPVITVNNGNMQSSNIFKVSLFVRRIDAKKCFLRIFDPTPQQATDLYVNEQTFRNIQKKMFNISDYSSKTLGNDSKFQEVNDIYVYVYDITKVEEVASILERYGYQTRYILKAFDNFGSTFNSIILSNFITVFIVFIFSIFNLLFAFYLFLRLQQRDIGILFHYGFSIREIYDIYSYSINRIFIKVMLLTFVYIGVAGIIFLSKNRLVTLLLVELIFTLLLFSINTFVRRIILCNFVKKSPIELINAGKEFK